jgi:hypothetical protein
MKFSTSIFSIEIGNANFNLEIESFDKLFEIYCFFLLKDVLLMRFRNSSFKKIPRQGDSSSSNSQLGVYELVGITESDTVVRLYYECLSEEFIQFASVSNPYLPDFVVEFVIYNRSYYLIFDAKFKRYNYISRDHDLENLTLKYLHKIGLNENSESKILGLFSISLSTANQRRKLFLERYDLRGSNPIFPQIGNIEIDPKSFDVVRNVFNEIFDFVNLVRDNNFSHSKVID